MNDRLTEQQEEIMDWTGAETWAQVLEAFPDKTYAGVKYQLDNFFPDNDENAALAREIVEAVA